MRIFGYIRILPLLVLVAMFSFAVRIGDFVSGLETAGSAFAQEEVHNGEPPPLPASPLAGEGHADAGVPALPNPGDDTESEEIEWQDASDAEFEYSEVRAGLYKDLVARRKELEQREKELMMRAALLEAGERELDQKLREMIAIRNEIEGLLQEQSAEEVARIESLVKIYEGMKAKDAASIFNTLDMSVLMQIMARMSERKSAPILAEMVPDRARSVTILLAEQKKLPTLVGQ